MGPKVDSGTYDNAIPAQADVVVIGGGIVGTNTALFLARKNISVVLCEKGHIAGEQSSRNWGWVRKQGRDSREIPLIIESMRLWTGMNELVGAETGFRTTGILYVCDTDEDAAKREAWLELVRPYQLDTRLIGSEELSSLMPGANRRFKGALYTASDGRAEPQKAAPAIAQAARRDGATILTQCAVRGVETTAGRVTRVVTEKGPITCNAVVLAGGAWSRLFCHDLGIRLPQLKVCSSVLRTEALEGGPISAARLPKVAYRKRLDGGYTIASVNANIADIVPDTFAFFRDFLPTLRMEWKSLQLRLGRRFYDEWSMAEKKPIDQISRYEQARVLDPEPEATLNDQALAAMKAVFPVFEKARVAQQWAGMIDVTPDAVPVISQVDGISDFVIATGFSGHGFGIGPGAGQLAADLVTGDPPIVDPTPFRFSRFTDGSRPRPEVAV
ncbi:MULTISPECIES: NAD(P)/FAD-dependent oxidoreductase [Microvirga]|uniref:NAD(P)/FAD-dependent oxidoreductase n=1 Tax=Microvirga TaxID=186650 RepID=UPI0021CA05CE|nr:MULTISPECIES: FAD-binding oxidoreductase [unclassified Microvirga]